jgi:hypothetical protein
MFFAPKASQTCAAHNAEKTVFSGAAPVGCPLCATSGHCGGSVDQIIGAGK